MFFKKTKSKGKTYISLVESYRDKGKIKHRVIAKFGNLKNLETQENFQRLAASLKTILSVNSEHKFKLEEEKLNWGITTVYKKIWNILSLDEVLDQSINNKRIKFNFKHTLFLMVVSTLQGITSKNALHSLQTKFYNSEKVSLSNIYKVLDILSEAKESLEKELIKTNSLYFTHRRIFYDLAPLFFTPTKRDTIDKKIILGLFINEGGLPIKFDIYFGNTFSSNAITETINDVKQHFKENEISIITDRDLNDDFNLHIKDYCLDRVVLCKFDNLKKTCKKRKCNMSNCAYVKKYQCKCKGQCCSFRHFQAYPYGSVHESDKPKLLSKMCYGIWNQVDSPDEFLDDDSKQQKGDFSNDFLDLEKLFSIFKANVILSKMRHFTPQKIKGHLVVCFLALLIQKTLESELSKHNLNYSQQEITKALDRLEFSVVHINGCKYIAKPALKKTEKNILRALKIKMPNPKM